MKISFILIFNILFGAVFANPPEMNKKFKKEVEKHFNSDKIVLSKIEEISTEKDLFFKVSDQGAELGIAVLTEAEGRFDKFDYMIIYKPDLKIELIKILVYRSQYGSEITAKRWLSQFYDKQNDSLKYGSDIQAISGATFSASALTKNINRINKIIREDKD
jgi:Na+-translocating ferredoxin:NAD+ oxidoreductase RnfG subunit